MKLLRPLIVGLVVLGFFSVQAPQESEAAFHLAIIDEVVTSYGGDPDVQFVEIRMLAAGQNIVSHSILASFDTSGAYIGDVLEVPSNVANSGNGVRWLMGTSDFATVSGLTPDFIMPAGLLTDGGMLCWGAPGTVPPNPPTWSRTTFTNYIDCIAYGTYSGPSNVRTGTPTTLDGDGHSLQRMTDTDDNLTDFICGDPSTPRNNVAATVSMAATTSCLPDDDDDGVPNIDDDCPGTAPAADVDGNGCSDAQVDADDDGICDPGAPSGGFSGCQLDPADNCPNWPNPGQGLPPWTVPANDPDCDGWDSVKEAFYGTTPLTTCPANTGMNNEDPDPWPPDFNDDRLVDVTDLLGAGVSFKNSYGATDPDPDYYARFDLSMDDTIAVTDLLGVPNSFKSLYGQACTP